jgi:hypothetical protein
MAFHPFQSFRKHQRALFAGLTIVCMLSFVMSSGIAGVGDGFSWLQQKLMGTSKYPIVGQLFGKNVDAMELKNLGTQRSMANRYMILAIMRSQENIFRDAEAIVGQLESQQQSQILQLLQMRRFCFDPAAASYRQYFLNNYLQTLAQSRYSLLLVRDNLAKANKTSEADKIGLMQLALQADAYLLHNPKDDLYPNYDLYFGGGLSNEALMDFMIWQKEADRLGIYLSREDVVRAVQLETYGKLTNEDGLLIDKMLMGRGERSAQVDVVKALGEEFRVRLAQMTLLGYDPGGVMSVPAMVTPSEFYDYFKRNRTEVDVKVLPIPVSKFIDQVKDKPTDAELTKLFDQYKTSEFNPLSDTPGFKQPRRIKVEWIGAKSDASYYRKEARKWILGALAAIPGNPWSGIALLDPVVGEYNRATTTGIDSTMGIAGWTSGGFAMSYETYAHFQHAGAVASLLSQLAGASIPSDPLTEMFVARSAFFSALSVAEARESKTQAAAIEAEARRRAPACAALVTAGLAPSPVLTMSALWQVLQEKKYYLPMEVVKSRLVARLEDDLARDVLKHQLEVFKKDLEAARGHAAEATKVIDKFVKQGGWEHEASDTFDDLYNIGQDPKMAKLKEAYLSERRTEDPKGKFFGGQFFAGAAGGKQKLYTPEDMRMPFGSDVTYVFWRTADEPAKVLSFEQAKPQVEKAWRFQKARELAKQEAERILKQSPTDPVPVLMDAAKKLGETPFDLYRVAYLRPAVQARAGMGSGADFEEYRVPESLIEYAPRDLVEKLLTPGTLKSTVLLSDQPGNIQYVAVITNRMEPSVKEFQRDTSPLLRPSQLLGTIEHQNRIYYRLDVQNNLRKKAGLNLNETTASAANSGGSSGEDDS